MSLFFFLMETWKHWLTMEIKELYSNGRKSIYKHLAAWPFITPGKVSGQIFNKIWLRAKEILESTAIGTVAAFQITVIRGCGPVPTIKWIPKQASWQSLELKCLCYETRCCICHLNPNYLYTNGWAWDEQMLCPRSWEHKNHFLKVLTCRIFIIRLGLFLYSL